MNERDAREIAVPIKPEEVGAEEWQTRTDLAAAFRVASHFGWNNTIQNHFSARLGDCPDTMIMNPRGIGWHEVTASSLIKSDFEGNDLSESPLTLAPAGRNFHSAIFRLRSDINCVLHVHPMAGVVVSALDEPLLPIDQSSAMLWGKVSYHDYEGLAEEAEEGPRIVEDLGQNRLMIMRNHGLLTVGRTIGEAFAGMHMLVDACETQVRVFATGRHVNVLPEDLCRRVQEQVARRGNNAIPTGGLAWKMYRRLAFRLDPDFQH